MSTEIQHPDNWLYIEKQPIKKNVELIRALFKSKVRFGARPKRLIHQKMRSIGVPEVMEPHVFYACFFQQTLPPSL